MNKFKTFVVKIILILFISSTATGQHTSFWWINANDEIDYLTCENLEEDCIRDALTWQDYVNFKTAIAVQTLYDFGPGNQIIDTDDYYDFTTNEVASIAANAINA